MIGPWTGYLPLPVDKCPLNHPSLHLCMLAISIMMACLPASNHPRLHACHFNYDGLLACIQPVCALSARRLWLTCFDFLQVAPLLWLRAVALAQTPWIDIGQSSSSSYASSSPSGSCTLTSRSPSLPPHHPSFSSSFSSLLPSSSSAAHVRCLLAPRCYKSIIASSITTLSSLTSYKRYNHIRLFDII